MGIITPNSWQFRGTSPSTYKTFPSTKQKENVSINNKYKDEKSKTQVAIKNRNNHSSNMKINEETNKKIIRSEAIAAKNRT